MQGSGALAPCSAAAVPSAIVERSWACGRRWGGGDWEGGQASGGQGVGLHSSSLAGRRSELIWAATATATRLPPLTTMAGGAPRRGQWSGWRRWRTAAARRGAAATWLASSPVSSRSTIRWVQPQRMAPSSTVGDTGAGRGEAGGGSVCERESSRRGTKWANGLVHALLIDDGPTCQTPGGQQCKHSRRGPSRGNRKQRAQPQACLAARQTSRLAATAGGRRGPHQRSVQMEGQVAGRAGRVSRTGGCSGGISSNGQARCQAKIGRLSMCSSKAAAGAVGDQCLPGKSLHPCQDHSSRRAAYLEREACHCVGRVGILRRSCGTSRPLLQRCRLGSSGLAGPPTGGACHATSRQGSRGQRAAWAAASSTPGVAHGTGCWVESQLGAATQARALGLPRLGRHCNSLHGLRGHGQAGHRLRLHGLPCSAGLQAAPHACLLHPAQRRLAPNCRSRRPVRVVADQAGLPAAIAGWAG